MIPTGEAPSGGSVMYDSRPWTVSSRPNGVPSCKKPEAQSLQGKEDIVEIGKMKHLSTLFEGGEVAHKSKT